MDRLSVYKTYVEFSDGSGEKAHPIIILANNSTELSLEKYVLAVYSFKEKFNAKGKQDFYKKILYEIKDAEVAGLDPNLVSYANIADVRIYPFKNLLEEAKYLGELSIRDSLGVITKYNDYHST
ncbi:hypothetical protein JZO70_14715 [Enterococcus sp. 669A]|uniref:Type II toxin-antitoxin system PemK/MazF family toxin n=1 Tax=Candidatus Enterococcus moelleringii TaxID=2815325 RepID=A0ABS3LCR5_9ENTE|nr:hypothetical protein [Enterococcus sp. 669A]MBO1307427.1 hypothetical protein [Enterococcus sp. 669A]